MWEQNCSFFQCTVGEINYLELGICTLGKYSGYTAIAAIGKHQASSHFEPCQIDIPECLVTHLHFKMPTERSVDSCVILYLHKAYKVFRCSLSARIWKFYPRPFKHYYAPGQLHICLSCAFAHRICIG